MDLSEEIKKLQSRVADLEKGDGLKKKKEKKEKKEKKPRAPTAFQTYMKVNIPKVKAENPAMSHKDAFSETARQYTESKTKDK